MHFQNKATGDPPVIHVSPFYHSPRIWNRVDTFIRVPLITSSAHELTDLKHIRNSASGATRHYQSGANSTMQTQRCSLC